jgi:DNA-binding transcriptional regulator YiaG
MRLKNFLAHKLAHIFVTEGRLNGMEKQKIYNKFQSLSLVKDFSPNDIKQIRQNLDLSQSMLAGILGVHKRAVESWEIGRKIPNGSARRLMTILQADPDAIRRSEIAEW